MVARNVISGSLRRWPGWKYQGASYQAVVLGGGRGWLALDSYVAAKTSGEITTQVS